MTCYSPHGSHPVNVLRRWLADRLPPDAYPPGGQAVLEPFHGTAFFTAGTGLIVEDRQDPAPPRWPEPGQGIMFVGNHLDSVANFNDRRSKNEPHGGPEKKMETWKGVYQLLEFAGVDRTQCFFTNCYVGLVEGSAVGRHPAFDDPSFRQVCWGFLQLQLELLRPAVVAVLGGHARDFLVDHVPALRAWKGRSVTKLTAGDDAASISATITDGATVTFTLLVHPSNYTAKPHFMQKWRGVPDSSVEADILQRALTAADS